MLTIVTLRFWVRFKSPREKKKKNINRKQLYILFELTMVDLSQPFQGGEKPDYINLKFINFFLSLQVVSPFFLKIICANWAMPLDMKCC